MMYPNPHACGVDDIACRPQFYALSADDAPGFTTVFPILF
jgi:hypothetical protein